MKKIVLMTGLYLSFSSLGFCAQGYQVLPEAMNEDNGQHARRQADLDAWKAGQDEYFRRQAPLDAKAHSLLMYIRPLMFRKLSKRKIVWFLKEIANKETMPGMGFLVNLQTTLRFDDLHNLKTLKVVGFSNSCAHVTITFKTWNKEHHTVLLRVKRPEDYNQ